MSQSTGHEHHDDAPLCTPCTCPLCGGEGEYRNVGPNHWGTCEMCGIRYRIGSNLFSSWRDETAAEWEKNAADLEAYRLYEEGDDDAE